MEVRKGVILTLPVLLLQHLLFPDKAQTARLHKLQVQILQDQTLQRKLHLITDHVLQALPQVPQVPVRIVDLQTVQIIALPHVLVHPITILPEVAPVLQVKAVDLPIQAVPAEEVIQVAVTQVAHVVVATRAADTPEVQEEEGTLEAAAPADPHQGDNK